MYDATIVPIAHIIITESENFFKELVTADPGYKNGIASISNILSGPKSFHLSPCLPSFGRTTERTRLVSVSMKACQGHRRDNSSFAI